MFFLLRLAALMLFVMIAAEHGFCHSAYPSNYDREKGLQFDFYQAQKLTLPEGAMKNNKFVKDDIECVFACMGVHWCRSINFEIAPRANGLHACELISLDQFTGKQYMGPSKAYKHYSLKNPCQEAPCRNGGNCTLQENRQHYNCECKKGFEGEHCDQGIRLVGSSNKYEGRIEVFYNGTWGTVCDDYWPSNSAIVACRQLGFNGVQSYLTSVFGQGTDPIWLDNVICNGNEARIQECRHRPWGKHDCNHKEDVGIKCSAP